MKLSEVKAILPRLESVTFKLPNGNFVPEHFHVTEVGIIQKKFIDCGGTIRNEYKINFQLWYAQDFEHRLSASKLLKIIELSEKQLDIQDGEIEVEYQGETIGKYDLSFDGKHFVLVSKHTNCLALGYCIPNVKPKIKLSDLNKTKRCNPNTGCC